jgi:hypothetical protein
VSKHTHTHTHVVYISAFFFPTCKDFINIKNMFFFFGEVKDSVIFPFSSLLHKRARTILPP